MPRPGIEPRSDDFQSSAVTDLATSAKLAEHIIYNRNLRLCEVLRPGQQLSVDKILKSQKQRVRQIFHAK